MSDSTAVPMLVHSSSRDSVEMLNSLLRNSGLPAHCTWIPGVSDIADALEQLNPQLLVTFDTSMEDLAHIASMRDQVAQTVPLIVLREHSDEAQMTADIVRGARDSVSLAQPERVTAVMRRELRAFRMERTLTETLNVAQDYRDKLQSVLRSSQDAIALVHEGIVVEANAAWAGVLGHSDSSSIVGQPIMDFFDADTQTPLRGALSACARGQWHGMALKTSAIHADRSVAPLELQLSLTDHDGEPSVQLTVPAAKRDQQQMASDLAAALHQDAGSGLWTRRRLLQLLAEQIEKPVPGGARYLVCIRPDRLPDIEREVGLVHSDEFMTQFATLVRAQVTPKDLLGHFGDSSLLLLAERGNQRDLEAWCESLIEKIGSHPFSVGDQAVETTCSIGAVPVPSKEADLNDLLVEATGAAHRSAERGGKQLIVEEDKDQDTRVRAYDAVWVRHIKAALIDSRFRLVQQPIVSLTGSNQQLFDIAVRMIDLENKDVLPSEFLPAAGRNGLLRGIDRWVSAAALALIVSRKPDLLMVRISRDSALDADYVTWLASQVKLLGADPGRLCLQFAEEDATMHVRQMRQTLTALRGSGIRLALAHFGTRPDSLPLLDELPLDFVKIDGSLMQGLNGNVEHQNRIRGIIEAAGRLGMQTVAERIEDANTMAVVFQLGVHYIQGYLVHAPEEVVLGS